METGRDELAPEFGKVAESLILRVRVSKKEIKREIVKKEVEHRERKLSIKKNKGRKRNSEKSRMRVLDKIRKKELRKMLQPKRAEESEKMKIVYVEDQSIK